MIPSACSARVFRSCYLDGWNFNRLPLQVTQLLQCLAEVRGSPIEQLQGAVELIADHLDVSLAR